MAATSALSAVETGYLKAPVRMEQEAGSQRRSLPADLTATDAALTDMIRKAAKHSESVLGLLEKPAREGEGSDVRVQMQQVVGDLENVLGELKTVVGDIKTLVTQIDVVTNKIDSACCCADDVTHDVKTRRSSASVLEKVDKHGSRDGVVGKPDGGAGIRKSVSDSGEALAAVAKTAHRPLWSPPSDKTKARPTYVNVPLAQDKIINCHKSPSHNRLELNVVCCADSPRKVFSSKSSRHTGSDQTVSPSREGEGRQKRPAESDLSSTSKSLSDFHEEENYILAQFRRKDSERQDSIPRMAVHRGIRGLGGMDLRRPVPVKADKTNVLSKPMAKQIAEKKSKKKHGKKVKRDIVSDTALYYGHPPPAPPDVHTPGSVYTLSRFLEDAARSVASDDTWESEQYAQPYSHTGPRSNHRAHAQRNSSEYCGVYEREMEEKLELELGDALDLLETVDDSRTEDPEWPSPNRDHKDSQFGRLLLEHLERQAPYDKQQAIRAWTRQARRKMQSLDSCRTLSEDRSDSMTESSGDFLDQDSPRPRKLSFQRINYCWRTIVEP